MTQARETKRQALLHVADFSRHGALAQLFIMDALLKQGVDVPGYQPGDTNISILTDLLDGDELGVFRLAKMTPFSGISASKNDPLSLRL